MQGGYVILANKQQLPCLGIPKIRILMNGHPVIIVRILHIPAGRILVSNNSLIMATTSSSVSKIVVSVTRGTFNNA